jgi:hypothetical protein
VGSIRRDAATAAAAAACLALLAIAEPAAMVQDSWLTLVAGRLVATSGIPHHELLTVWAHGRTWIDQQWLAQLLFYRTYTLGGVRAVLALSALLSGTAWVLAVALSRARGASGLALLVWAPATIVAAPWAWQARAQTFALPLFVCLLALVFADSRKPSPRVFLALPLLALWGNLHGTAILGVGILGLHALVTARRGMLRAVALGGGGLLALAANPYGLGIASYYRTMTLDPPFASLVAEWKPSTPSLAVLPFYALALISLVAAVRKRRELTATELAVLAALLVVAFDAKRSITWFALAALVVAPPLVHLRRMPGMRFAAPARVGVLLGTVIVLAVGIAAFPGAVSAHQTKAWSVRGAGVLGRAAAAQSNVRVLVDDRHSDFVLWELPSLQGRVIADVRFELLNRAELDRLVRFERGPGVNDAGGARLVVLDPKRQHPAQWRSRGWTLLYADPSMDVLER